MNQRFHGFYPFSYTVMMLGLSGGPAASHPLLAYTDPRQGDGAFAALRRRGRELCDELPSHGDYLDALYDGRLGADLSVATTSPPSSFVLGP